MKSQNREFARPRVLVVNDDEDSLFLLHRAIVRAQPACEILEERSAQGALKLLKTSSVDLIITDNTMPLMSGLAMIEAIRVTDTRVPIVLMTGSSHLEAKALAAGASMFLSAADYSRIPGILGALLPTRERIEK